MYRVSRDLSDDTSLGTLPEAQVPHMLRSKFTGLATGVVKLYYFDYIARVQAKGKLYDRVAILTKDQLVVASLDGKIRRCINVGDIKRIVYEKSGNMALLEVPSEYDLLLRVVRTRELFIRAVSTVSRASVERCEGDLKSSNLSCPKGREKNKTFFIHGAPPSASASSSGLSSAGSGDGAVQKTHEQGVRFADCCGSSSSSSSLTSTQQRRTWAPGDEREAQVSHTSGWEEELVWMPCTVTAVDDELGTTNVQLHHSPFLQLSMSTRSGDSFTVPNNKIRSLQKKRDCPPSCWCQTSEPRSESHERNPVSLDVSPPPSLQVSPTSPVAPTCSLPRAPQGAQPFVIREADESSVKTATADAGTLQTSFVGMPRQQTVPVGSVDELRLGAVSPTCTSSTGTSANSVPQVSTSDAAMQVAMPIRTPIFTPLDASPKTRSPWVTKVASPSLPVSPVSSLQPPPFSVPAPRSRDYIALYDFEARSPDEVTVRRGDALTMVSHAAPDNGWCTVTNGRTLRAGYLPLSYATTASFTPYIQL